MELTVNGCAPIVDVGSQPVATWNVEGLKSASEVKFAKLRLFMQKHGISVLCI